MSRFQFELAGPDADADLRQVMASTPMPGRMSISMRREPSWFDAAVVDGFCRQVVACRDHDTGRIFGFGCRSLRKLYVNGQPATVGYLSSLRVLPEYRKFGQVARGYAFFRRLHEEDRHTPFYLTTIAEGNEPALRILTSGRARLPIYHPAGRYHTVAVALPRKSSPAAPSSRVAVRPAQAADLSAIVDFLSMIGPRRQFFPVYRAEDFRQPDGLVRGLELGRLLIAERDGRIVGTLAAWDQHAFRQQVVHGYAGPLRYLRPAYNLLAWLRGLPGLPRPGEPLRILMGALPVIAEDDPTVFSALLTALRQRCGGGPWTHLLVGLHERDPLLSVLRRFAAACYTSLLYLVCWPDGDAARLALDDRPAYLELGSL